MAQINEIGSPEWSARYDRRQDILVIRRAGHGPATSYFAPAFPEVLFRLDDAATLVGVDLTDFRRALVGECRTRGLMSRAREVIDSCHRTWLVRQAPGYEEMVEQAGKTAEELGEPVYTIDQLRGRIEL
jgi:hypothetical protein